MYITAELKAYWLSCSNIFLSVFVVEDRGVFADLCLFWTNLIHFGTDFRQVSGSLCHVWIITRHREKFRDKLCKLPTTYVESWRMFTVDK